MFRSCKGYVNAPQCYVYTYVTSVVGIKRRMNVVEETIEVVKCREVKPDLYHRRQRNSLTKLRLTAYNFLSHKAGMSLTILRWKC